MDENTQNNENPETVTNDPTPFADLLGEMEVADYTGIPEIFSLRGIMQNATDKRVSWMTRRNEVEEAFEFYSLENPGRGRLGELTMIQMLRLHLMPQPCPSCVNKTYDDTRWHKVTDEGRPILLTMTPAAEKAYGNHVEDALRFWVVSADKLEFELVDPSERYDAILEYGQIDGPRNTVGYVSRLAQGDLGQTIVRLRLDSQESWTEFMILEVLKHEFGHLIGIGHTPRELQYFREIMFPIYYSIRRGITGWTKEELHGKYGAPVTHA